MEPPLPHIHSRSLHLKSAEKLPKMSSCIQDTTYFAVFLADDSEAYKNRHVHYHDTVELLLLYYIIFIILYIYFLSSFFSIKFS